MLYAVTILVSAFLLFQVQPLIARYILPWFGGSPAVWTTSMLFFQTLLLIGYSYAHWIISRLKVRFQVLVHIGLLAAALVQLPIIPNAAWQPDSASLPVWHVLFVLALSIGLPYLALASTSPLIQAWFSRANPGKSPYRLYALSNAGSLAGLLTFPFLFEPYLTRNTIAIIWSVAFGGYVILSAASAIWTWRKTNETPGEQITAPAKPGEAGPAPTWPQRLLWLFLAATAVIMLLAVTNQITQDVAVVPFLWVLPLAIYLLTFIIAFDAGRWYARQVFMVAVIPAIAAIIFTMVFTLKLSIIIQVALYSVGLFVIAMVCHGELNRLKPASRYLTGFYLMISLGGALGGVFVALIAPVIFNAYLEMNVGLGLAVVLVLVVRYLDSVPEQGERLVGWRRVAIIGVVAALAGALLVIVQNNSREKPVYQSRNFYGVLTVQDQDQGTDLAQRMLIHGVITHGTQFLAPDKQDIPTTYYSEASGGGLALLTKQSDGPVRVGIVGLGAGTLAAYGQEGDAYRIYEINPEVLAIAERDFTYLADSDAEINVILGDARLSMEREPAQHFDVLILDAFSGDAVPAHLLTIEAFAVYLRHLEPDGVIAVHISNRFLDLKPVVDGAVDYYGMETVYIPSGDGSNSLAYAAEWMLVSADPAFLRLPEIAAAAQLFEGRSGVRLWTDDYTSLFPIIKFE